MSFRALLMGLCLAAAARAGGGPETTLVVVNAASPASRLVANEYVALRDIPRTHVVEVEGAPHQGVIPLDQFLSGIWKPIEDHMRAQGLEGQIDLIVYSTGFPYAVNFGARGQHAGSQASLTGLTFLIRSVLAEEEFWDLEINGYYGVEFEGAPRRATADERRLAMRADAEMRAKHYAQAAEAFEAFLRTYETHELSWYNYACCLSHLGKKEAALAALGKAVDHGFRNAEHAAQDPDLAPLRGLRGFAACLERMRTEASGGGVQVRAKPSRGYHAKDGLGYLSTRLGYTGRFGNSVPEILASLRAAASADGTSPDGTVYFCRNGDVRSKAREPFWPALEAGLKQRGRKVELVDGKLPPGKDDVIGAVLGIAGFSWPSCKSRILPGAICEHLTSFGAHFGTPGQTKLSELVRYGAAGASGTVQEPFAIHQKFPNPLVHVFYADGCSLAEAFYQSIWGPYQLMVAGDGLARPFAHFRKVDVDAPQAPWTGTVKLAARAECDALELWVDGRRVAQAGAGEAFDLDTTALADGWHDVRVVALGDGAIETRSYARLDATVRNQGREVAVKHGKDGIEARAPGAKGYRLLSGARVVATAADGKLAFDPAALGPGPVELVVEAEFPDGTCRSEPIRFAVDPPPPAEPVAFDRPVKPGLGGSVDDRTVAVTSLGDRHAGLQLAPQLGVDAAKHVTLEGWFEAPRDGFYELYVEGRGKVTIEGLCRDTDLSRALFLPLSLRAGWHPIRLEFVPQGKPDLALLLGGEQVLGPLNLEHATFSALPKPPSAPKGLEALVDGERAQPGLAVPDEGLILSFRTTAKNVTAVTLFPGNGSKPLPSDWKIETTRGSKWLPVKDLCVVVGRPPTTPKGQPEHPLFVELSFAPVSARKVRLTVKEQASLAEVEVLGLNKARKPRR